MPRMATRQLMRSPQSPHALSLDSVTLTHVCIQRTPFPCGKKAKHAGKLQRWVMFLHMRGKIKGGCRFEWAKLTCVGFYREVNSINMNLQTPPLPKKGFASITKNHKTKEGQGVIRKGEGRMVKEKVLLAFGCLKRKLTTYLPSEPRVLKDCFILYIVCIL